MSNMTETARQTAPAPGRWESTALDELYQDTGHWHVNTGAKKIHAKRMGGKFRSLKWAAASLYLLFFFGPFLRWEGGQAVLFDIPNRKYHLFGLTLWPQDVWILALLLLTFFLTLYAATAVASRVFCGYFCWQTVWTDVYTWIEEKLEGTPQQRRALDEAPMSLRKLRIKGTKALVFLLIGTATGVAFTAYFIDVFDLLRRYATLQGPVHIWAVPVPFIVGTYLGVGIMREQFCFWLCPYARIQSVMQDTDTKLPTYDLRRGEPRGRLKKGETAAKGDCVDCNLCVGVCPTGIDIRNGMQEGCITCGLCIDACDSVMAKVGRPAGLIRYASLKETAGRALAPLYRRPRVIFYALLLAGALSGIVYGLTHLGTVELNVIHERQPLYVMMSDGSVQNKYILKILNKSGAPLELKVGLSDLEGGTVAMQEETVHLAPGKVLPVNVAVRVPRRLAPKGSAEVEFHLADAKSGAFYAETESRFIGPN